MFDFLKKKTNEPWLKSEYDVLEKKKVVCGEFIHSEGFRGFKRIQISTKYPEAVKNLKTLIKNRPVIPATSEYSGEKIDLTGCLVTLCISETKERYPVIMVYIDGLFVGHNIPGDSGKPAAVLLAIKSQATTAVHVEIRFGTDINKNLAFDNYLMVNGVKEL